MTELGLRFGALSPSILSQVEAQGYTLTEHDAKVFQGIADSITRLKILGYLPESQAHKSRQKLIKDIARALQPLGALSA